jgi:MFS transporter, DHA1 family, tetracycline resistance protein
MSATTIVGPVMMTNTFAYFTSKSAPIYFPGSSFLLGAILMIASAFIAYYSLHVKKAFQVASNPE